MKDWIIVSGTLVDSTRGGGLEFLGPYTADDAQLVRDRLLGGCEAGFNICFAIQLIRGNLPERFKTNETAL